VGCGELADPLGLATKWGQKSGSATNGTDHNAHHLNRDEELSGWWSHFFLSFVIVTQPQQQKRDGSFKGRVVNRGSRQLRRSE
jgi:hypothetical protein